MKKQNNSKVFTRSKGSGVLNRTGRLFRGSMKTAFRNSFKKPIYSFITFTGFIIGIAGSLLICLWIRNEMDYETFHPDHDRIYRVLTLTRVGDEIVKSAGCYRPLARSFKQTYPQIEEATYLSYDSEDSPFMTQEGGDKIEARCATTNNDFFSVFGGFTFLEGSPEKAFSDPSCIVLSETVARKLFGKEPALHKTLISDKYEKMIFTVSGVVRIPSNGHIDFGCLIPETNSRYAYLVNSWADKGHVRVYIKLAGNAFIDEELLDRMKNHLNKVSIIPDKLVFQPIDDIHLHSDYQADFYDKNVSSYKYILIFSGLAILILLMSTLNFSILSVARSSERSTEIGMRKVCGASRGEIIVQFMGEAVLQTVAATVVAILLIRMILPWFNGFTGQKLSLQGSLPLIASLCILTLLSGVTAGFYPSLYLSSFNPLQIFRGGNQSGSGRNFTRVLVVVQFMIATFFIISALVFIKQLNYIQGKDLGFDRRNIVVVPTGLWYDNRTFKEELLRNPDILGVSGTSYAPVDFNWTAILPVHHTNRIDSVKGSMMWVDEDFLKTYKLQLLKGHFLDMNFDAFWEALKKDSLKIAGTENGITLPAVINETTEKAIGFANPVGERIGEYVIVGVVKDFNFRPLHYPIGPLLMVYDPQNIMTMSIHIRGEGRDGTLKFIRDTYQKFRNNRSFSYSYFDDLMAQKYQDETRLRNLTLIFVLLAIIISVLGILGMSVFSCDRRSREIGIRKANGAGTASIMLMLNKDFIIWVVLAFILAAPVSWYFLRRWLSNFAYQTGLSWWIFAFSGLLSILLALIAVNWQTYRAARKNPVETFRNE